LRGGEEFIRRVKHRSGEAPVRRVTQREEAWTWRDVVKRVEARLNVALAEGTAHEAIDKNG